MKGTNSTSLDNLPTEILNAIFRQLDPVGLVAINQTCHRFRSIIQIESRHLAERLLALELTETHGGINPKFNPRDNSLEPDWTNTAWKDMRWACTRCLRLRSHEHFDNHSLLRLKMRKPREGSDAAKRFGGVTSWEPIKRRGLPRNQQRKKKREAVELHDKYLKKIYHIATTWSQPLDHLPSPLDHHHIIGLVDPNLHFIADDPTLLASAAHHLESLLTGSHRFLRTCNECRFQLGHFNAGPVIARFVPGRDTNPCWAPGINKGTPTVPIIRSRFLRCRGDMERFFPGLERYTQGVHPPAKGLPVWRTYRDENEARDVVHTLHMVRCQSCGIWRELRTFRFPLRGWKYGVWLGIGGWISSAAIEQHHDEVNALRCNRCFAKDNGEEALAEALQKLLKRYLNTQRQWVQSLCSEHWGALRDTKTVPMQFEHKQDVQAMIQVLEKAFEKWDHRSPSPGPDPIDFDRMSAREIRDAMANMKGKRAQWLRLKERLPQKVLECVNDGWGFFGTWQDEWDLLEDHWTWLEAVRVQVLERPKVLVQWAMEDYRRGTLAWY